jgi:hypothetical protein
VARPARNHTLIMVVLVSVTALAGCVAGTPDTPFPPRPQEIDISRLDPCALLPSATKAELGVRDGEPGGTTLDGGAQSRNCGWDNFDTGTSYSVQLVGIDAAAALGDGRSVETVGGYGAVRQIESPESAPLCALVIDINAAQMARVLVLSTRYADGRPRPIDDVCTEAAGVATGVVETARRLAG